MMTKNEKIRLMQMLTEKYTVDELHELTTLLKKDAEYKVEILPIGDVSDCQFEAYAKFCIVLDRQGLDPINHKDYLKIG